MPNAAHGFTVIHYPAKIIPAAIKKQPAFEGGLLKRKTLKPKLLAVQVFAEGYCLLRCMDHAHELGFLLIAQQAWITGKLELCIIDQLLKIRYPLFR